MPRHPPYALSSLNQGAFNKDTYFALTLRVVKERVWLPLARNSGLIGGDNRARTGNLRRARAALSQLSYIPKPVRSFPKPGGPR